MDKPSEDSARPPTRVIDELRDKIRSKMDVAKFFAGFITVLIGFLLTEGDYDNPISVLGLLFIIASLIFCVATIFSYDTLLMPREFWSEKCCRRLTEIEYQDLLLEKMIASWRACFIRAVICFGVGLSLAIVSRLTEIPDEFVWPPWASLLLLLFTVAIPVVFAWLKRPRI